MNDLMIYESGNGGELSLKSGDIETTQAVFNQFYLAHFGGNTEASTTGNETEGTERMDWWGNMFLNEKSQMNSSLEKTLQGVALTSAGRVEVEREARKDIDYLSDLGELSTVVQIIGNDKIQISDKINQSKVDFIWDATKSEVIEEIVI
jgi:hypothetical protein